MKTEVSQGSVLSPNLFAWYMQDITPAAEDVKLVIYVDDITVYSQDENYETADRH